MKPKVLFLCTGNSCRSQMAEGWAKHLLSEHYEAYSAGTEPQKLNPNAVTVMQEVGVDLSGHYAKSQQSLSSIPFDFVVTVCDSAAKSCSTPLTRAAKIVHAPFDDPPNLAQSAKSEEEALGHYRRVRDEIKQFVLDLPNKLRPND